MFVKPGFTVIRVSKYYFHLDSFPKITRIMGRCFRENDILGLFISYSLKKSCQRNHRARVVQGWELSPPTNVAWVQIPASTPYAGWVCCRFFHLLRKVFLRVQWFPPLITKTTFSNSKSIRNQVDYVYVLPLNHYLFFYLNINSFIYQQHLNERLKALIKAVL